jgi:cysteine-rich repeat protein
LLERGRCRDGVVQRLLGEQCEPALQTGSPLKCGDNCKYVLAFCGDGKTDAGELCDAGLGNTNLPNASCRPDCSPARCGDYIVDTAEQCDDGNRMAGDGCDSFCRAERYSGAASVGTLPATVIDFPFGSGQSSVQGQLPQQQEPVVLPGQLSQVPATTDTGPEVLGVMAAGAAAGYAWMRRRRAPKF